MTYFSRLLSEQLKPTIASHTRTEYGPLSTRPGYIFLASYRCSDFIRKRTGVGSVLKRNRRRPSELIFKRRTVSAQNAPVLNSDTVIGGHITQRNGFIYRDT